LDHRGQSWRPARAERHRSAHQWPTTSPPAAITAAEHWQPTTGTARPFCLLFMEPGSLVMERKMLLGIKKRAERLARDRAA
jgi:hypothetical protein